MGEFHPGHDVEHFDTQMIGRAHAGRGEIELARLRSGQIDKFLEVAHRQRGIHHQQIRHKHHQPDGREIAVRIERHLCAQRRADGQPRRGAEGDGVAVGRGARAMGQADHRARARAVVDHHLLAERFADLGADFASDVIGGARWRVGDDQADRLERVGLRLSPRCQCCQ